MTPATPVEFRRAVQRMRQVCPLPCQVQVRRDIPEGDDDMGRIHKTAKRFVIQVRRDLPLEALEETLIHEWAHAMDWCPPSPFSLDHGPTWGVRYAQAYRAYQGVA